MPINRFQCTKCLEERRLEKMIAIQENNAIKSVCYICFWDTDYYWNKKYPPKPTKSPYPSFANILRTKKLKRLPSWANLQEIIQFYEKRPKGYCVHHIYPLEGKFVSGLHVIGNLEYVTTKEHGRKHVEIRKQNNAISERMPKPSKD